MILCSRALRNQCEMLLIGKRCEVGDVDVRLACRHFHLNAKFPCRSAVCGRRAKPTIPNATTITTCAGTRTITKTGHSPSAGPGFGVAGRPRIDDTEAAGLDCGRLLRQIEVDCLEVEPLMVFALVSAFSERLWECRCLETVL